MRVLKPIIFPPAAQNARGRRREKIMQNVSFSLKGIRADEMRFELNNIRLAKDAKFDLKPSFSRQVRKTVGNEKLYFVTLAVKIEHSEESPKPFNLSVRLTGMFETGAETEEERKAFTVEATATLYPYLRAAVTNLTTAAFAAPLMLPVVNGPLFPEDREEEEGPRYAS